MADPNQVHSVRAARRGPQPPIKVYVNGEEWTEGQDFMVDGPDAAVLAGPCAPSRPWASAAR